MQVTPDTLILTTSDTSSGTVPENNAKIVLGFDYGTRRIGVAVGQALTRSATPLKTIEHHGADPGWTEIDQLVREWQPQLMVVGIPYHADGSDNSLSALCRGFGKQLQQRYGIKTCWVDERLTSSEAERIIRHQSRQRGRSTKPVDKSEIDKVAAKLIIESWFNQHG